MTRSGGEAGPSAPRFEPDGQGGYALTFDMAGDGRPWLQFHSSGQAGGAGLRHGQVQRGAMLAQEAIGELAGALAELQAILTELGQAE